jgi:hypothetical protein
MTSAEASRLFRDSDSDVCGRLTQLDDGTLVMAEHGVADDSNQPRWQFHIRAIMGVIAALATTLGIGRLLADYAAAAPSPQNLLPKASLRTNYIIGKLVPRARIPSTTSSNNVPSGIEAGCKVSGGRSPV